MVRTRPMSVRLCLVMTLAVMAAVYAIGVRSDFTFVDENIYYRIAYNLHHLHSFTVDSFKPTAIRPPGYPWLLAATQMVNESVKFAKLCNLALWLPCSLLAASIARKLFGRLAATVALLLCITYVIELYIARTLYPQTLCSFLLLLSLWMHFVWLRSGRFLESVLQGLTWGLMVAAVPVFLVNLVVYAAWLFFVKRRLAQAVIIVVMVSLPCAAWTARNSVVMHGLFISDNTGEMLLYGNSDLTGPNTGPQVPIWSIAPNGPAQQDELAEENIYKATAIRWMSDHPRQATLLYLKKFANWFNCQLNLRTSSEQSSLYQFLIAVVYYPLLLACLLSPWLLPASRKLALYFALQYLIADAAYAVFFTRIRYRLPYDYLILILASGVCAALIDSFNARRPPAPYRSTPLLKQVT